MEILMIIVHSFRSLQSTFEARASEWALASAMLLLSIVFLTNDTMYYGDGFAGMRSMIRHQSVWAFLFGTIGILRLSVLIVNGAYWRTPHFRAVAAFLCCGVWFLLFMAFARNGAILLALLPPLFFLDAYNVKRAAKEAGQSEFFQRYYTRQKDESGGRIPGVPEH